MRANRFVPYLGIFGFPIVAAAAHSLWPKAEEREGIPETTWRIGLSLALVAFMVATAAGPLERCSPWAPRKVGVGIGPRIPAEEIERIIAAEDGDRQGGLGLLLVEGYRYQYVLQGVFPA